MVHMLRFNEPLIMRKTYFMIVIVLTLGLTTCTCSSIFEPSSKTQTSCSQNISGDDSSGCNSMPCTEMDRRCVDNNLEICDESGRYKFAKNCNNQACTITGSHSETGITTAHCLPRPDLLEKFVLGLNYPWNEYSSDFGKTTWGNLGVSSLSGNSDVDTHFATMAANGTRVVRWFLFGDGRASPEFDSLGMVTGLDDVFFRDIDAAFALAEKHKIYIMFVLIDFLWFNTAKDVSGTILSGHSDVATDPNKRQSFINNALIPLVTHINDNEWLFGWDLINEPLWATTDQLSTLGDPISTIDEPISTEEMLTFLEGMRDAIKTHSNRMITVGTSSLAYLSTWNSVVDVYQLHYYEPAPFNIHASTHGVDGKILLGEFATATATSTANIKATLDAAYNLGYAGAFPWSFNASDGFTDFDRIKAAYLQWSETHDIGPWLPE